MVIMPLSPVAGEEGPGEGLTMVKECSTDVTDIPIVSSILMVCLPVLRNYAEIIDTFHFLKHASILYF